MIPSAWTPVALSADLAPGTAAGVVLEGAEVVVWRDEDGRAQAWEDRCPHRGMKLSFGFVRGRRLACLYHGWQYGADGRCRHIPAHPDLEVPATITVARHALAEAGGLIWVRAEEASAPLVDLDAAPLRSLFVDAALGAAMERLGAEGLPGLGEVEALEGPAGLLRLSQGGLRLLAGGHAVGPRACALHLLVEGAADRAALVPATAALRRALEAA